MWFLNKETGLKWEIDEKSILNKDLIKMLEDNPDQYQKIIEKVASKKAGDK